MKKKDLTNSMHSFIVPAISTICIILAFLTMYVIQTDYTNICLEAMCEKEAWYVFLTTTPIEKKIILLCLSTGVICPYAFDPQRTSSSEIYAWFRLSTVAAISIIFFVLISPTQIRLEPTASAALEGEGLVDAVLSRAQLNRFALSSPISILFPISWCILTHCFEQIDNESDVLGICTICLSLLSIYMIYKTMDYYYLDVTVEREDHKLIQPYTRAVIFTGIALILSYIHDWLKMSRHGDVEQEKNKTDMLFMGICVLMVCLPSIIYYCLCLTGVTYYEYHSVIQPSDTIQTLLSILVGLAVVAVCEKRKTREYIKMLPFYFILWLSVRSRSAYSLIRVSQIAPDSSLQYGHPFAGLSGINFWCFLCVAMLFYTFYLVLEKPGRKRVIILCLASVLVAAMMYLPPYTIEVPYDGAVMTVINSISSISLINICIELISPILLISFGYRQKHI